MKGAAAAALLALARAAPAQSPAPAPAPRVLSLEEAVRTAGRNQPQLQQARAGTEAAAARADEARAPLLPQISGTLAYTRSTTNARSGFVPPPGETVSGSGSLSQLLWDFGQAPNRFRAARAAADAQRQTEEATRLLVVLGVRAAFFTARAAKDLVAVARETLANQEAHLRQIQGFVEVGTRPEIDLAQARTDRANSRVQLIVAENGYEVAKAQLNQAMGVEGRTDYDVADETLPPVEGEDRATDQLLEEALRARPEVASLESQVRAQRAVLWSVQGAYLPTLRLTTGVVDSGNWSSTAANWSATLSLGWDIFQGGLTRAQEQEANANLSGLDAQVSALRQQVRLELDQARLAVRAASASLEAAQEALVNARERLRLAEGRYQTGAGSIIELGDAQVALTAAAAQRVQADYSLATARAQLLKALGRPA